MSAAFGSTIVVKEGDEEYPSLWALAMAANMLGVGCMASVSEGRLISIRLPHSPEVVRVLVRLATACDEGKAQIDAVKRGETVDLDQASDPQFAVYAERGRVWIKFGEPIDGIGLTPQEADRVGSHMIQCAVDLREEVGREEGGAGPVEA